MQKLIGQIISDDQIIPLFLEKETNVVSKERKDMKQYAQYLLAHPWAGDCFSYDTESVKDKENEFLCEYNCICFDGLEISVFGYGKTPQEAEEECQKFLEIIQTKN